MAVKQDPIHESARLAKDHGARLREIGIVLRARSGIPKRVADEIRDLGRELETAGAAAQKKLGV